MTIDRAAASLPRTVFVASVLLLGGVGAHAQIVWDGDCDEFWDGGCSPTGMPEVKLTNWEGDVFPMDGDSILIQNASVVPVVNVDTPFLSEATTTTPIRIRSAFNVSGSASLQSVRIELTAGTFTVTVGGQLSTSGSSVWAGGDIRTPTFRSVDTLTLEGNSSSLIDADWTNQGTVIASGRRQLKSGATIVNEGLWSIPDQNADVTFDGSPGALFTNSVQGGVRRSGEGVSSFKVPFRNEGARIELQGGRLAFSETSEFNGGDLDFSNNAELQLINPSGKIVTFTGDTVASGVGNLRMEGVGEVRIEGTLDSSLTPFGSSLGLGFVTGSTVTIDGLARNQVGGLAVWSATEVQGEGAFVNEGELVITTSGSRLKTRLENKGRVDHFRNLILEGGTVESAEGGVYRIFDANVMNAGGENRFRVVDGATLEKASGSSATINAPIDIDSGNVEVLEQGVLFLANGGTIGGNSILEAGAEASLILSNGELMPPPSTTSNAVSARGAGVVTLSSGAVWSLDGRLTLAMDGSESAAFEINGGTIVSDSGARVHNFGRVRWSAGEVSLNDSGAGFGEAGFANESSGQLEIDGVVSFTGILNNRRGAMIDQQGGALTLQQDSLLFNDGEYRIDGGTINGGGVGMGHGGAFRSMGTVTVGSTFTVFEGEVEVIDGSLTLQQVRGFTLDEESKTLLRGDWKVGPEATLNFPAGQTIERIGPRASVRAEGNFPALQLETVDPGARVELLGPFGQADAALRVHGVLVNYALLRSLWFRNEPTAKTESVLDFLEEAIVIASEPGPASHTGFENGFQVEEGFENAGFILPGGEGKAGYFPVTGDFSQTETGFLEIELGGPTNAEGEAAQYDQLAVSGTAALDGQVRVRFIDGFEEQIQNSDTFTIVHAGVLEGAFGNLAQDGRLYTVDGVGSFTIDYTEEDAILSDYQPGADPNAALEPRLWIREDPGESIAVVVEGSPGAEYFIERSEDLLHWEIVAALELDAEGVAVHQEPRMEAGVPVLFRTRLK